MGGNQSQMMNYRGIRPGDISVIIPTLVCTRYSTIFLILAQNLRMVALSGPAPGGLLKIRGLCRMRKRILRERSIACM
jgi:hypothetical protein